MCVCIYGASQVAPGVKNPPANSGMQETWVPSMDQEDPVEESMATHFHSLAWSILMDRRAWWATVHRVAKNWTN